MWIGAFDIMLIESIPDQKQDVRFVFMISVVDSTELELNRKINVIVAGPA